MSELLPGQLPNYDTSFFSLKLSGKFWDNRVRFSAFASDFYKMNYFILVFPVNNMKILFPLNLLVTGSRHAHNRNI